MTATSSDVFERSRGRAASLGRTAAKRSAAAGFFGTMLEYYEMYVYASASALIFGRVFFSSSDPGLGTLLSIATFGVAFVVRPLAAVVLGHFGDRVSRKKVLLFTLFLMGGATFMIGCLPTYATVGFWAPLLLVLMRVLQGISAAGEQVGSSTLTLEHAPPGRRAFFTSFTPAGSMAGFCVATLVFLPVSTLPEEALFTWGWRVPFWFSAVVVVVAYFFRRRLEDPALYEQTRDRGEIPNFPVVTMIKTHPDALIRVFLCSIGTVVAPVFSVFGMAFATSESIGVSPTTMLWTTVVANFVAAFMPPVWGMVADRTGRKPAYITGLLGSGLCMFFYFWSITTGNVLLILLSATLLMGFFYSAANGLFPSFYAEMFNTKVRFSGVAIGTQAGWAIGGFAPTIGWAIIEDEGMDWFPIALMVLGAVLVAALAAATARETYRTPLEQLGKPVR